MDPLVLAILTGLEVVVLLLALGFMLHRIARALQCITVSLQKIAMGVRAIEQETGMLIPGVTTLNESFGALAAGFDSVELNLRRLS